jgi:histidine triad (HIT) family protein
MDCVFCKIASGQAPANVILEHKDGLVIDTIGPLAPNHVLVIPRRHVASLAALTLDDRKELLPLLFALANAYADSEGLNESGYRTVFNTGSDAYQTVHHLHLHVVGGAHLKKEFA